MFPGNEVIISLYQVSYRVCNSVVQNLTLYLGDPGYENIPYIREDPIVVEIIEGCR